MVCFGNAEDDQEPLDTAPDEESPERPPPEPISSVHGLLKSFRSLPICKLVDKSTQDRPKDWATAAI